MLTKTAFRVNIKNADIVLNEVDKLIDVAKIYGSGRLIDSMLDTLKEEYSKEVGKSAYQSGISVNDSRSLMNDVSTVSVTGDRRQIKVKEGAKVEQDTSSGITDVAEILHMIQRGWKEPDKRKVFRLGPARRNNGVLPGGYMVVTGQKPKPFVANTVKLYKAPGSTNAGTIMDKEMAKKLRRF